MNDKNVFDDGLEYFFSNNYNGSIKFNSAWHQSFIMRYVSVANEIVKIKRKDITDKIRILDLGCSNKTFWRFWNQNFQDPSRPRIDYIGLEYRQDVVDKANLDLRTDRMSYAEVRAFNAETQSLPNEKYDAILMMEILEHLNESTANRMLDEAKDLLTDRGFIVVSSPNPKKEEGEEFVWPENHIKEYTIHEMREKIEKRFNIRRVNGWYGKANYMKSKLDDLTLYNDLKTISSGFATSIISYLHPEIATAYTFIGEKND